MKILVKYIAANAKERKLRTAVMLLSILLSTALLFVSFSVGASYENAQQKMARGRAGRAEVSVTAVRGGILPEEIPDLPSIENLAGILEGSALYHEDGYYESVDLAAFDLDQLEQINPPRLSGGGRIEGFTGNQIILPDRFTSKFGIKKGDAVTLQIDRKPVRFEVAEIAAYDTVFLRHTRGATALVPLSTLAGLLGKGDGFDEILVEPAGEVGADRLAQQLEEALTKDGYRVSKIVDEKQIAADARQKSMPFFLISFFSLTMSIFIIYSSYKIITLDRLPVIGTFRSIGAAQGDVTRILLLESLLYGAAGGLAGIPAGWAALHLILRGMGTSLPQGIEISPVVLPPVIFISLAAALLTSLLSAWIPVRRASRLPIKEVVLGTVEEAADFRPLVLGTGVVLFAVSLILPRIVSGKMLYLAGGVSLVGLIGSTILAAPLITDLASSGMEFLYGIILGNEGWLAARNMRGNKNTVQNITLLFISISAVIVIRTMGDFVTAYVGDVFRDSGLQGFADGVMDQDFVDDVRELEGMDQILPLHVFKNQAKGNGITFSRMEATDNLELYHYMLNLLYTERGGEELAVSAFEEGRAVILSESCLERTGFRVGDRITLSVGPAQQDYEVAGSFKSRATDVEAVIPSRYAVSDFGVKSYGFLAYTAADPDTVMIQIRDLFGETPNWSRTVEEFEKDALSTVGTFLQPMHSMTGFILALAAVGIVNNLLINYIQRRRSIAVYRSVGLGQMQSAKIALIEGFSSGLIGGAAAVFVSFMELQTIFLVAGPKISMAPELKAEVFLGAGIAGVAITMAGSLVPVFQGGKMKLAEEIKAEGS